MVIVQQYTVEFLAKTTGIEIRLYSVKQIGPTYLASDRAAAAKKLSEEGYCYEGSHCVSIDGQAHSLWMMQGMRRDLTRQIPAIVIIEPKTI